MTGFYLAKLAQSRPDPPIQGAASSHALTRVPGSFSWCGSLADSDDDEFCRLERGETDKEVDDASPDIGLRGGLAVTLDEI